MAITDFDNVASFSGQYGDEATDILEFDSTIATVSIVDGLTATKTASQDLWVNGALTYTVVINNTTDVDYTTPTFTDVLNALIALDQTAGSVQYNGADIAYTYSANTLTIALPTIVAGTSGTVTFRVLKA